MAAVISLQASQPMAKALKAWTVRFPEIRHTDTEAAGHPQPLITVQLHLLNGRKLPTIAKTY